MHQLENSDVDMVIPVDGIRSAVALAWDSHSDSIFWTDIESDTVNRAHLNGSRQRAIISSNLGNDLCLDLFASLYLLNQFSCFIRKGRKGMRVTCCQIQTEEHRLLGCDAVWLL
jgi:hypothetical protein